MENLINKFFDWTDWQMKEMMEGGRMWNSETYVRYVKVEGCEAQWSIMSSKYFSTKLFDLIFYILSIAKLSMQSMQLDIIAIFYYSIFLARTIKIFYSSPVSETIFYIACLFKFLQSKVLPYLRKNDAMLKPSSQFNDCSSKIKLSLSSITLSGR